MTAPARKLVEVPVSAPRSVPPTEPVSALPAAAVAPPVASPSAVRARPDRRARWKLWAWLLGIALPLGIINLLGAPYYTADMATRVRHPWHTMLRPSGTVGLTAGIAAVAIFIFLWLYPLRKKHRRLAFLGSLGKWMDVHVASALALPLLLAIHSAWRADGLIGLGLLAMFIVIGSGVVGRYLYVRIPRARNGVELSREDVAARRRELIGELADRTGLGVDVIEELLDVGSDGGEERNPLRILARLVADDLLRRRRVAALERRWSTTTRGGRPLSRRELHEVVRLASQEMSLQQQTRMLDATHRVFRFWHVAHRPFAITALVAVVIHVAVVVAMGVVRF